MSFFGGRDESYEAERRRREGLEPLEYSRDQDGSVPERDVPTEIDERSTARTDFIPNDDYFDSPEGEGKTVERYGEKVNYTDWLSKLHHGHQLNERTGAEKGRVHIRKDIKTIASVFNLTDAQRERAIYLVDQIGDLNDIGRGEAAALAAVSLAVNENNRWVQNNDKSVAEVLDEDEDGVSLETNDVPSWRSVLDDYNTRPSEVRKARERLREEL